MPINEVCATRPVSRIPDLCSRPVFNEPWQIVRGPVPPYFYRICNGGDIYTMDIATGNLRRF